MPETNNLKEPEHVKNAALLMDLQIINVGNKETVYTWINIEIIFIYFLHCLNIRVECKVNLIKKKKKKKKKYDIYSKR